MKKILASAALAFLLIATGVAQAQQTRLKVGVSLIVSYLPLFAALEKGYLIQEGLTVEMVDIPGGPKKLEALAGGSLEIAGTSVIPIIKAAEQGFDFIFITPMANSPASPPDIAAIVIRNDSTIRDVKQLEEKKIALSATKQIDDLTVIALVKKEGGDPRKLIWVEMPYGQHLSALENRLVDAALMIDPFLAAALASPNLKILSNMTVEINPGGALTAFVATGRWLNRNADAANKYARAIKQGINFINGNTQEARNLIPKYTRLAPEVAGKITLSLYKPQLDVKNLQWVADLMLEHGWLKKRVKVDPLVYVSAR